jgi:hypothetical protein
VLDGGTAFLVGVQDAHETPVIVVNWQAKRVRGITWPIDEYRLHPEL